MKNERGLWRLSPSSFYGFEEYKACFWIGMRGIKAEVKGIDLQTYAKYVLREGLAVEKRELLVCIKSKFIFKNNEVTIEKTNKKYLRRKIAKIECIKKTDIM